MVDGVVRRESEPLCFSFFWLCRRKECSRAMLSECYGRVKCRIEIYGVVQAADWEGARRSVGWRELTSSWLQVNRPMVARAQTREFKRTAFMGPRCSARKPMARPP